MSGLPLIDEARVANYAALLPLDQVRALLTAFARELDTRPALLAQLAAAGDVTRARAAAHHFKGAALSVGGTRVAAAAQAIELAGPDDLALLVAAFATDAATTLAAVERVTGTLGQATGRAA